MNRDPIKLANPNGEPILTGVENPDGSVHTAVVYPSGLRIDAVEPPRGIDGLKQVTVTPKLGAGAIEHS